MTCYIRIGGFVYQFRTDSRLQKLFEALVW
jgi:hypothetical protein